MADVNEPAANAEPLDAVLGGNFLNDILQLGTWNVGGIGGNTNKITKQTRLNAIEFCRKSKCDIVALQETKHRDTTNDENAEKGYTIYFIRRNTKDEEKEDKGNDHGLAFFVRNSLEIEIIGHPKRHDSRIASLYFKFKEVDVTLLNFYAPANQSNSSDSIENSKKFYEQLKKIYGEEQRDYPNRLLILCGDFNAFPDSASTGKHEPWMMRNVWGTSNVNGRALSDFLYSMKVYHLNSRFEKDVGNKWTWQGRPRGVDTQTEIDGFMSDRYDIVQDVDTLGKIDPKKIAEEGTSEKKVKNETDEEKKKYIENDEVNGHRMVISTWRISSSREDYIKKVSPLEIALKEWTHYETMISTVAKNSTEGSFWEYLKALTRSMYFQAEAYKIYKPLTSLKLSDGTETLEIKSVIQKFFETLCSSKENGSITLKKQSTSEDLTEMVGNMSLQDFVISKEDVRSELELFASEKSPKLTSLTSLKLGDGTETMEIKNSIQECFETLYFFNENGSITLGKQSTSDDLTDMLGNMSLEDFVISEEDVLSELERFVSKSSPKLSEAFERIINLGGEVLIREAHEMFNSVSQEDDVPVEWKTVLFKLPNQKNSPRYINKYEFKGSIPWLGCVYSNLLARKLNETTGNNIHNNSLYFDKCSKEIENQRNEDSAEKMLTITLLIEAFQTAKKPLHFVIFEYYKAFEKVKLSSVIESLARLNAPKNLHSAFSSLLTNTKAEIKIGEDTISIDKKSGLHLGDVSSKLLFSSVIKMIFEDCDKDTTKENAQNVKSPNDVQDVQNVVRDVEREDLDESTFNDSGFITDTSILVNEEITETSFDNETDGVMKTFKSVSLSVEEEIRVVPVESRSTENAESPTGTENSTSEMKETIPMGIEIGGQLLQRLHFDNKIVLIDTGLKKLQEHFDVLSEVSKKHGLEVDNNNLFFATNNSVGKLIKMGEKEVSAVSATCYQFNKKLSDAIQQRTLARDIAIYATMPQFLSRSKEEKKKLFDEKFIPALLYNCKTWKLTDTEIEDLQDYVNKLLGQLGLTDHACNVKKHVVLKKAEWMKTIMKEKEGFCAKLLKKWTPSVGDPVKVEEVEKKWIDDLVVALKSCGIASDNEVSKDTLLNAEASDWDGFIKKFEEM